MHAATSTPPTPEGGATEPRLPRTFGRYTLFEQVGRGGMAEIYLARAETELGATRLAVVKQILPAFADDPRFAEMLIHEAKLAAKLGHRRTSCRSSTSARTTARPELYIAMEYVEGFDLNSLLRRCTERRCRCLRRSRSASSRTCCEGLDYAHRRTDENDKPLGIVHRDVSPSNVLISFDGEVKLCDFGIAARTIS